MAELAPMQVTAGVPRACDRRLQNSAGARPPIGGRTPSRRGLGYFAIAVKNPAPLGVPTPVAVS